MGDVPQGVFFSFSFFFYRSILALALTLSTLRSTRLVCFEQSPRLPFAYKRIVQSTLTALHLFFPSPQAPYPSGNMCLHVILRHPCGHLTWCAEVFEQCQDLHDSLHAYINQPDNASMYRDEQWALAAPRPCQIYWPATYAPEQGLLPYLQPLSCWPEQLPMRDTQGLWLIPWTQDVYGFPWPGQIQGIDPALIVPYQPHGRTNAYIRLVPWDCGCHMPGLEHTHLSFWERHLALAYEFGRVSFSA